MSKRISASGACLCGKVIIKASSVAGQFGACHCSMCRKWGGGPFMAVNCDEDVIFEGQDYVISYDSSEWAERGFCVNCGTHLYYRLKHNNQYNVPVGLFGKEIFPEFVMQWFIDKKPGNYSFADKTQKMTEKQICEMYEPSTN